MMSPNMVLGSSFVVFLVLVPNIEAEILRDYVDLYDSRIPYGESNCRRVKRFAETNDNRFQRDSTIWHFDYRNTDVWGKHHADCNGMKQSPVDLNSKLMIRLKVLSSLKWNGYRRAPRSMTIVNNGHTVQLSAFWDNDDAPYLSGGTLVGDYAFHQLHFHWGTKNGTGSEHTINNIRLPLEMHMVHYKKEYGSASEAMKFDDGLAVVGIFFKVGKSKNNGISILQRNAEAIKTPGKPSPISPFPLTKFHIKFVGEYVSYLGSLTTPPCSEIVTWIFPANPRFLSQDQLDFIRSINLAAGDDHNYRPVMPLNGRMLYFIN